MSAGHDSTLLRQNIFTGDLRRFSAFGYNARVKYAASLSTSKRRFSVAVKYRPGHCSLKTAMRVLHVDYSTVVRLLVSGALDGGKYRGTQRSRWVSWESVVRLHRRRLIEKELAVK